MHKINQSYQSVFFNLHLEHLSLFGTQFLHKFNQPQIKEAVNYHAIKI